nr:hypothetical protein GCM10020093_006230 [Planobispora longispora]
MFEHVVGHARGDLQPGQAEPGVERVALGLLQGHLQLGPAVGRLAAQQLLHRHVQRGGQAFEQGELRLALAVLQQGELARRPADPFAQVGKGEPALLAQVPQPLTEGDEIKLLRQRQRFFPHQGSHALILWEISKYFLPCRPPPGPAAGGGTRPEPAPTHPDSPHPDPARLGSARLGSVRSDVRRRRAHDGAVLG